MKIRQHLSLLGYRVRDRVTGFEGVISSVSFDLCGCVQAVVSPSYLDKDGKIQDAHWFDVGRLEVLPGEPVMTPPDYFDYFFEEEVSGDEPTPLKQTIADGKKGPACKPLNLRY